MPSFKPLAERSKLWGLTVEDAEELRRNPRRVAPDIVRLFAACRIPITLWGPVGARKTRTLEALAQEKDENGVYYQVITLQPSTEDPTVIHGLMYTSQDADTGETVMERSIPDVAQQIIDYYREKNGLTFLFLDEMTTCMPAQQHALLGILTHGKYGDLDIQDYITIVMAANPEGTVNTVYELDVQFMNRGGHLAWYGDPELFLEEWSSGFGHDEMKPDPEAEWFITTLLHQDMENAFRNPRWSPDELVPWDLLEHSERTTTEVGKIFTLINEVFKEAPVSVRHHYIVEAVKALQGREWAKKAAITCSMEHDRIDGTLVVKKVRDHEVTHEWTTDQLLEVLGHDMHYINVNGTSQKLGQDQVHHVASDLLKKVEQRGYAQATEQAIALWAFAITSPDDGTLSGMHGHLVSLLSLGFEAAKNHEVDPLQARPEFVTTTVRETLREALQRAS